MDYVQLGKKKIEELCLAINVVGKNKEEMPNTVAYCASADEIWINEEHIKNVRNEYGYSHEEVIDIILSHEIGHTQELDFNLKREYVNSVMDHYVYLGEIPGVTYGRSLQILMNEIEQVIEVVKESELFAWHQGRKYVQKDNIEKYEEFNEKTLSMLMNFYNKAQEIIIDLDYKRFQKEERKIGF